MSRRAGSRRRLASRQRSRTAISSSLTGPDRMPARGQRALCADVAAWQGPSMARPMSRLNPVQSNNPGRAAASRVRSLTGTDHGQTAFRQISRPLKGNPASGCGDDPRSDRPRATACTAAHACGHALYLFSRLHGGSHRAVYRFFSATYPAAHSGCRPPLNRILCLSGADGNAQATFFGSYPRNLHDTPYRGSDRQQVP